MLQLVGQVSIPKIEPIFIDKDRLIELYKTKFLSNWQYIAFAIKMSYQGDTADIYIPHFCEEWDVTEKEFSTAIAQIHKKRIYRPIGDQLSLELVWSEDDK